MRSNSISEKKTVDRWNTKQHWITTDCSFTWIVLLIGWKINRNQYRPFT